MEHVLKVAQGAKVASFALGKLDTNRKNAILHAMGEGILAAGAEIISQNALDVENARKAGKTPAMLDRLSLNEARVAAMAQTFFDVEKLPDPIGEVVAGMKRPNGLNIIKRRVPLGVIGIIYEARPNVTADAMALCIKTANTVVLRGGSEAIHSNMAIVKAAVDAGVKAGLPTGSVALIEDTSREAATYMMGLNGVIDVLIPRGGAGLIQSVVKNATIPVIETGTGNCHIYMDKTGDADMGVSIIVNAKTSRPSVCNAAETLLVHKDIADEFLPKAFAALKAKNVELRGCETAQKYGAIPATEEDYYTEFLDYILAVKVVDSVEDAIAHINKYGTRHSEAIVTHDYDSARKFQDEVDAAAVYVNASTRWTDGFEFGFGAEIGISTQKLHARGPMGLTEMTTIKYVIDGNGQVR
jgi:glutamate-5-semialdehyde dehydrogenase